MAVCGDYDATYRRFRAQNGKAAKAEKMLRGLSSGAARRLEGKMRVWRGIPDDVRERFVVEGYRAAGTAPRPRDRVSPCTSSARALHLARCSSVSADDIVDHHLRVMMEWMLRVLLPVMAKREGTPAPDKVINLLDMKGLSRMRALGRASMSIFKRVLAIDQNYFPEVMYRCYIVNCPVAFRAVWSARDPCSISGSRRRSRSTEKSRARRWTRW